MLFQETIVTYSIKMIIIIIIIFLIISSLIIKLYYKNNSCKLYYIWEKLNYQNINKEIIKIKNKLI